MKMKRIISAALTVLLLSGTCLALAADDDNARAVIGANLNEEQINSVYATFGVTRGSVPELMVTNKEERTYLEGLVPDSVIGTFAISSVFVKIEEPGSGLNVSVSNVTWCTGEMYKNAIVTAGIDDASIIVTAPFPVTGTAALSGIYKAYEDLTGEVLSSDAKLASSQELVITADLADEIGSYDAVTIVNELKVILEQTRDMSDSEVRAEIRKIAADNNIAVTDSQVDQLVSLCRSLEKMSPDELQQRVESIQSAVTGMAKVKDTVSGIAEGISNFFKAVGGFFSNLFGGSKKN